MPPPKALLLTMLLAACIAAPPVLPDSAILAPGALGPSQPGADPDMVAATLAQDAFADAARTYGRPVDAARAAAALDFLAGDVATSPRWANIDPDVKAGLLQARRDLRTALGASPAATSQQIVDSLTAAARALDAGNQPAALQALATPAFPAGPENTIALLNKLPYIRTANLATQLLANQIANDDASPGQ